MLNHRAFEGNPEGVGEHLREGRAQALADARDAHERAERSVGLCDHPCPLERAHAALADRAGDAGPDQLVRILGAMLRAGVAGTLEHGVELRVVVARTEAEDVLLGPAEADDVRQLRCRDQVAPAQLDRVDRDTRRDQVEHSLAREGRFHLARAPERPEGRLVRQDPDCSSVEAAPAVRAVERQRAQHRWDDAVRAHVGAHVAEVPGAEGKEPAVGGSRDLEVDRLLPGVVEGDQRLCPVLDPFHGPAERHRGPGDQVILRIELAAGAECSSDVRLDEAHPLGCKPEHRRDRSEVEVLHLGGAPNGEPAVVPDLGDQPARLQRRGAVAMLVEALRDDEIGTGEERLDVAVADLHVERDVGSAGVDQDVAGKRLLRVEHRVELVDVEVHLFGRRLCDRGIGRR